MVSVSECCGSLSSILNKKLELVQMKYTYFLINLCSVLVPFIFSFHPKLHFHKHFYAFFKANFISASIFILWDMLFTSGGVWGFSHVYTMGPRFLGLPIEEILFFFCIPFACVFTYHCLNVFYSFKWKARVENIFILCFSLGLIVLGAFHSDKLYTSVTFISSGLFFLALKFLFKVDWLPKILSIYPILFIPFCIVNGILTGYGLSEPVVWYNNAENLSIRLVTIPVEDVIYGLELIILTLFFYEKFKKQNSHIAA